MGNKNDAKRRRKKVVQLYLKKHKYYGERSTRSKAVLSLEEVEITEDVLSLVEVENTEDVSPIVSPSHRNL